MVFNPKDKSKVVCNNFVCFSVDGKPMQFVTEFKYLGHVITCSLSHDKDLQREMRNMYIRTNTLLCRFGKCSKKVKVRLFRSYCLCMYGTALSFFTTFIAFIILPVYYGRFLSEINLID